MKKIYLNKIRQKGITFYSMIADPRLIAKVRKKYDEGEVQDVQRPWVEKKVLEISKYVAGKTEFDNVVALGIIPNTPILNFKRPFKIYSEVAKMKIGNDEDEVERYFVMFPTTEQEILEYENFLEIIDGQHRLIAFDEQYISTTLTPDIVYEMNFMIFDNLEDKYRKEIFMVTNEKQDKVAANLIRFLKKSLGLLGTDELVYDFLIKINDETSSPLHGRISFGYNKIYKRGYAETQLSKILNKYGAARVLRSLSGTQNDQLTKFLKIVKNYLEAWESASGSSFQRTQGETMTKISGLRYLFVVFPDFYSLLVKKEIVATKEKFSNLITDYVRALSLESAADIFGDGINRTGETYEMRKVAFSGESGTVTLAKEDFEKFENYLTNQNSVGFDPSAGL